MTPFIAWFAVITLIFTSVGILLSRDWRWLITYLSIQYVGMFIFTLEHWPLSMATVKVIAGWMGSAILGMTRSNLILSDGETSALPQGRLFRLLAAGVVIIIAVSAAPFADSLLADAGVPMSTGSLVLVGIGLLHLGVTDEPLRVTIGLMTVLSGFEMLYAAVESSILVAALLAAINLGLALAGSYLIIAANSGDAESA